MCNRRNKANYAAQFSQERKRKKCEKPIKERGKKGGKSKNVEEKAEEVFKKRSK